MSKPVKCPNCGSPMIQEVFGFKCLNCGRKS
jgi:DNA-directed RNA polymerase subunit RPC12/RpoP